MKNFFSNYQNYYKPIERLEFLRGYNSNKNGLIQYLIDLEYYLLLNNKKNELSRIKEELENRIENSSENIWAQFTLVIVYARGYTLDKNICIKALELLNKIENNLPSLNSFFYFYKASILYEYSKTKTSEDSEIYLNDAQKCIDEIINLSNKSELNLMQNIVYKGIIYNMQGNIFMRQKKYEYARKSFEKALKDNESFSYAWNGLGNYYREQRQYSEAVINYGKAIKCDENLFYPYNYLGDCFRMIERYDNAIKFYKKALELAERKGVITAIPLYGLGRVYYELGNRNNNNPDYYYLANSYFEKAEKCYADNNLDIYFLPQARFLLKDKARLYQKNKEYDKAIKIYENIMRNNLFYADKYYNEILNNCIDDYRNQIEIQKKRNIFDCIKDKQNEENSCVKNVLLLTSRTDIDTRVTKMKESFELNFLKSDILSKQQTEKINESIRSLPENISSYISEKKTSTDTFQCLRRWNSYTPIISNGRGGGYYLNINDTGIVIDPGYSFIKNYKETGNYFKDIDIVLVTHSHDDHTADVEAVFNMQHRFNKRLEKVTILREIAKEVRKSEQDVKKEIEMDKNHGQYKQMVEDRLNKRKKNITFFVSHGVLTKFYAYLTNVFISNIINKKEHEYIYNIDNAKNNSQKSISCGVVAPKDRIIMDNNTTIHVLKAKHKDVYPKSECIKKHIDGSIDVCTKDGCEKNDCRNSEPVGFCIETSAVIFVYTGDTGWNEDDIRGQYQKIYERNENIKPIILLAHIGGFEDIENNYWIKDNESENNIYYGDHLGRCGLARLVSVLKPDLCIISEFGEEFNGLRIELANIFNKAFYTCNNDNKKTVFIPADIGLQISLTDKILIKSICEIDYINRRICYKYVDPEEVMVGEYSFKNQLFYYIKNEKLLESDCIRAFIDGFTQVDNVTVSENKGD